MFGGWVGLYSNSRQGGKYEKLYQYLSAPPALLLLHIRFQSFVTAPECNNRILGRGLDTYMKCAHLGKYIYQTKTDKYICHSILVIFFDNLENCCSFYNMVN